MKENSIGESKQVRCRKCDGAFEAHSVVFEVAETDFVFTQSHCDACVDEVESSPVTSTRIRLEDLMEVIYESL